MILLDMFFDWDARLTTVLQADGRMDERIRATTFKAIQRGMSFFPSPLIPSFCVVPIIFFLGVPSFSSVKH